MENKPKIFETAFIDGTSIKIDDLITVNFYPFEIGKIKIASGKIIACAPEGMVGYPAFTQIFPKGEFTVKLAIAGVTEYNDSNVAYSQIFFSQEPVQKWELALLPGQETISIYSDEVYAYAVDGAQGLFIDEEANNFFSKLYKENDKIYKEAFTHNMKYIDNTDLFYKIYEFKQYNLVTFPTGFGDGRYSTFIGFDAKNNPCRLLTDFALINWWSKK